MSRIRPALLIILAMVLINACVVLYFVGQSNKADDRLQDQVTRNENLAKANRQLLEQQNRERQMRTDQNCEFAERTHLRDVQALRGTYNYLELVENTKPEDKDTLLYKLVLRTTPRTIAEGETDIAPKYCDDQGMGLKEPDPTVPDRVDFLPEHIYKAADLLEESGLRLDDRPIQ